MKKILSITVLSIMLFSCKKEENSIWTLDKSQNDGTLSAKLNGKAWEHDLVTANPSMTDPSKFSIAASLFKDDIARQILFFDLIDPMLKQQTVFSHAKMSNDSTGIPRGITVCIGSYSLGAYDVSENYYVPLEDSNAYINIEGYDPTSPRVKGTFQVTFYRLNKTTLPQTQNMPDTLRFTEGRFDVILRERNL